MAGAQGRRELHTYENGDTVRLPIEVRDDTGVGHIFALYTRLNDPALPNSWDSDNMISLQGNGEGQTSGEIELSGQVANQQPGVYALNQLEMRDIRDNRQIQRNVMDAPRFRVRRGPGDIQAPEIVRWGQFQG